VVYVGGGGADGGLQMGPLGTKIDAKVKTKLSRWRMLASRDGGGTGVGRTRAPSGPSLGLWWRPHAIFRGSTPRVGAAVKVDVL
jgi:hypothetical protein